MPDQCDACDLRGQNVELIYVCTTNGGVTLCRQCLDDINRKSPLLSADREECAKALETIAASSPPGSEPLGFHAGVRHACAGGAAAIRGRK